MSHGPPVPVARLACAALLALAAACGSGERPANLVLVVVDTLRADLGRSIVPFDAPALDGLARDGVSFERAFSHAPMTLPAHAALLSARPPHAAGVLSNEQDSVPDELPLLAEHLRGLGWSTGASVSLWTLGDRARSVGLDRGFERYDRDYFGVIEKAPGALERARAVLDELAARPPFFLFAHFSDPHFPYDAHDPPAGRVVRLALDGVELAAVDVSNTVLVEREVEVPPGEYELSLAADGETTFAFDHEVLPGDAALSVTPLVERFVRGRSPKSWRWVGSKVANSGAAPARLSVRFRLSEEVSRAEGRLRYPREVAYVDRFVGELRADLRARGLERDTLIVLTADHGEAFGEHGTWGHKETLYDELLHVPLVIVPPAACDRRGELVRARDRLASHADVVPTVLDLLGLPALPGQRGRSLLEPAPRVHEAAARLMRVQDDGSLAVREDLVALRDERWKLVHRRLADCFELYDVAADPEELHDLFTTRGAERADWQSRLRILAQSADLEVLRPDPAHVGQLQALGYVDGEPEEHDGPGGASERPCAH